MLKYFFVPRLIENGKLPPKFSAKCVKYSLLTFLTDLVGMYLEIITRHALASGLELSSFLLNSMVVIMLKFLAQTNVPSLHYCTYVCSFREFSYHFTNR